MRAGKLPTGLALWTRWLRPGKVSAYAATLEAIQHALEAAGVDFTNGEQPGVKLRKTP
jgi:hypothetical protein